MEIKICPVCGSKDIGMPAYSLAEIRISLSGQYYCKNCKNIGFPVVLDNEEAYQKFLKLKTKMAKIDKKLDIKGEVCPYTFVKSKLAIEVMKPGQVLEILVDHLPAVENVPRSLENEGHKVLDVKQISEKDWRLLIRKSDL